MRTSALCGGQSVYQTGSIMNTLVVEPLAQTHSTIIQWPLSHHRTSLHHHHCQNFHNLQNHHHPHYPQGSGIKSFLLRLLYEVVKRVGQDGLYWARHCQVNSQWWQGWWRLPYWWWHFGFYVLLHCQVGLQSWQWWLWWPYSLLIKKGWWWHLWWLLCKFWWPWWRCPARCAQPTPMQDKLLLTSPSAAFKCHGLYTRHTHNTSTHMHKGAYTRTHTHVLYTNRHTQTWLSPSVWALMTKTLNRLHCKEYSKNS